jgi:hypothetical protein
MENDHSATLKTPMRPLPWNKGKLIGPKPPRDRLLWGRRTWHRDHYPADFGSAWKDLEPALPTGQRTPR